MLLWPHRHLRTRCAYTYDQERMSVRSAKERLSQYTPVEHHCSQVNQQTSSFEMHFYTTGSLFYTCRVWPTFRVCITDRPYHRSARKFVWSFNLAEIMFHAVRRSFTPPSVAHALLVSLALGAKGCTIYSKQVV